MRPAPIRGVHQYGERAVLVECLDLRETLGLLSTFKNPDLRPPEILEIIPGAQTLLIKLSGPPTDRLRQFLLEAAPTAVATAESTPIEIEVIYDGADLAEVGQLLDRTTDEVIVLHTQQVWTVAFCGFAPGFSYLVGENADLRVPRRADPRTRVPAGAVGLADHWSGIYPRQGPGGWQLIGTTRLPMWDLSREPPALLQPGMRVQFVAVSS